MNKLIIGFNQHDFDAEILTLANCNLILGRISRECHIQSE